jgi:hypothetical protein
MARASSPANPTLRANDDGVNTLYHIAHDDTTYCGKVRILGLNAKQDSQHPTSRGETSRAILSHAWREVQADAPRRSPPADDFRFFLRNGTPALPLSGRNFVELGDGNSDFGDLVGLVPTTNLRTDSNCFEHENGQPNQHCDLA